MSTFDPAERNRQRTQAQLGSTGPLVGVLIGDVLVLVGAAPGGAGPAPQASGREFRSSYRRSP